MAWGHQDNELYTTVLATCVGWKLGTVSLGCSEWPELWDEGALLVGVILESRSRPFCSSDSSMVTVFLCRLLQTLNTLPVLGDTAETAALRGKHIHGVTADGKLWILLLVEYANKLLSSEHVKAVKPFTKEQRDIWDRWDAWETGCWVGEVRKGGKALVLVSL